MEVKIKIFLKVNSHSSIEHKCGVRFFNIILRNGCLALGLSVTSCNILPYIEYGSFRKMTGLSRKIADEIFDVILALFVIVITKAIDY